MRTDSFGLTFSLIFVFIAFCLLMAGVLAFCLHERRKIDGLGIQHHEGQQQRPGEMIVEQFTANLQDAADDNRVAIVLFGTIIGGAALALITGYLVFFRDW